MKLSEIQKVAAELSHAYPGASPDELIQRMHQLPFEPSLFYQELEMDSQYAQFHCSDSCSSEGTLQSHSHTFYELICCRNSCGAEYLIGTEVYPLSEGDIILVPSGVPHRPLLPEDINDCCSRDILWISDAFMQRILRHLPAAAVNSLSAPMVCRTAGTRWEYLRGLFRSGVQEYTTKSPNWEVCVAGYTLTLVANLQRAVTDLSIRAPQPDVPDLLQNILLYVERELSQKITLADVARQFYVSESTVAQTFRKKMDVSFYRYVTQRRLIAAKALIAGDDSMEVISAQVGFSDYSSFFRAFKQEYGISPNQYRKLQTTTQTSQSIPFF